MWKHFLKPEIVMWVLAYTLYQEGWIIFVLKIKLFSPYFDTHNLVVNKRSCLDKRANPPPPSYSWQSSPKFWWNKPKKISANESKIGEDGWKYIFLHLGSLVPCGCLPACRERLFSTAQYILTWYCQLGFSLITLSHFAPCLVHVANDRVL